MAKIKHTRNENGKNFTHQNKTTVFWRKKAKINLHQNFPIYGTCLHVVTDTVYMQLQTAKIIFFIINFWLYLITWVGIVMSPTTHSNGPVK